MGEALAPDHVRDAVRALDNVSGDYITTAGTPTAAAALLEAQVHATLAVAAALDRLLGHLETRQVFYVRDADRE